jgi:hypothetical protein
MEQPSGGDFTHFSAHLENVPQYSLHTFLYRAAPTLCGTVVWPAAAPATRAMAATKSLRPGLPLTL